MSSNSNIQVFHTFTIIGLTAESTLKFVNGTRSKIFGNLILEMKVCTNILSENMGKVEGLSKIKFKELLSLATKESYFIFKRQLYKQVD